MTFRKSLVYFVFLIVFLAGAIASCDTKPLPPPQITVNITQVESQNILDSAVAEALTGTAVQNAYLTETQLALSDVTLTPTSTSTPTSTPRPPTATQELSPTPSQTPTSTLTPTFVPLPSNTPSLQEVSQGNGRVRVLHAWQTDLSVPLDVYIDDVPVSRALSMGNATNYQSILSPTVRITLYSAVPTNAAAGAAPLPLLNRVVDVPAGGSKTIVIADLGEGLTLIPVTEDLTPLASGRARLNIVQASPLLLRSNVIIPSLNQGLAYNLSLGQVPGPYDLPAGSFPLMLYDADHPDQLLDTVNDISLDSRLNYLLVFVPPVPVPGIVSATDHILIAGSTNLTDTDVSIRFVNAATNAGNVSIRLDGQTQMSNLSVGATSPSIPVSILGNNVEMYDAAGERVFIGSLGPWTGDDASSGKIILLSDLPAPDPATHNTITLTSFSQNPRPAAIGSNIRLIHALAGTTVTLDLQIRSTNPALITNPFGVPQNEQADTSWSPVIQNVSFGTASDYAVRTPNVFDVQLVLSGTQSVQASITGLQLLAGSVYDFVALSGDRRGVAQLVLIQPDVQVSELGINQGDPEIIRQQVEAALTASAPAVTSTVTVARTPTPTISPVPTNTPRPSNTPGFAIPSIAVNPAPPDTIQEAFVLTAQGFAADRRYVISIDGGPEDISGATDEFGQISVTIPLPLGIQPGSHVVRVCVDCRPGGAQQEQFATFRVADPSVTATATPQP